MLKKNLIIIPARKGSKRIKNKNLTKVFNKPLIFWTINYAKKFKNQNQEYFLLGQVGAQQTAHTQSMISEKYAI